MTPTMSLIILGIVTSATGVVSALLMVTIQLAHDRRAKIFDSLLSASLGLETRRTDAALLLRGHQTRFFREVNRQQDVFNTVRQVMNSQPMAVRIFGSTRPLTFLQYAVFIFTVVIFVTGLPYSALLGTSPKYICPALTYTLVGLTALDFLLLVPLSYLSATKQYPVPIPGQQQ